MVHECRRNVRADGVTADDCKSCSQRQPLLTFFDRVAVVNLRRRPDRLHSLQEELRLKGWPFATPEVVDAVDGNVVPAPPGFVSGGGAWGCLRSHTGVLERAIQDGVKALLVIEDDLALRYSFAADAAAFLSNVPADWEMLLLGGQFVGRDGSQVKQVVSPGVLRVAGVERTHCYAVRGRALRELYRAWCGATRHCDHVMGPLQRNWNCYAPDPFLAGQARGKSDISGADNPLKFWQPPLGTEPVLVLDCDCPTVDALRSLGVHTGHCRDATGVDKGLVGPLTDPKLTRWLWDLQWEVVSEGGLTLGLWRPDLDAADLANQVRRCWKGPVRVVAGVGDLRGEA